VAGFVGVSNVVERDGRRFTIRPEKIRLLAEGDDAAGLHVEAGTVEDAAYVGMVTRYLVALDAGGIAAGGAPEPGDVVGRRA
jgi:putative spermidine/putrescine transport system ATP-binding protein